MFACVTDIAKQLYANPEERESVLRQIKESGGNITMEGHYRRKDGTFWYGMLHLNPVYDHKGNPIGH